MKAIVSHPHSRKQEKKLSSFTFADFSKHLHEVFSGACLKAINYFFDQLNSHRQCFISQVRWAKEAGVSTRTITQIVRLLKKANLIRTRKRWMSTSVYSLGSYFNFYARQELGNLFPALKKTTAFSFKFPDITNGIITKINVNNILDILNKSIVLRSNTTKDTENGVNINDGSPPRRFSSMIHVKGQQWNASLAKQSIQRKRDITSGITDEEKLYKIERYKKMRDEAMLKRQQQVVDVANREIDKLEGRR